MTKLINIIENDKGDRKIHTIAINAQTEILNIQTREMRGQH